MLSQISFANYKSFRDEVTLDLTPAAINEHKSSLISDKDGTKFLPVSVLYGPNGGGKTTVLDSLRFLVGVVIKPVAASVDIEPETEKRISAIESFSFDNKYYKFDKAYKNIPNSFDIFFRQDSYEYRYQLSILKNEITEENLYMRAPSKSDAEVVFERDRKDIYLGNMLEGVTADKIKSTIPLLSYLSINYGINEIDLVVKWFFNVDYIDYDNPVMDKRILIPKSEKLRRILFNMFREIDIRISDVRIEEDAAGNITEIYAKHDISGVGEVEIPLKDESSGTRKLISLLPRLLHALQNGSLVIADEMDAKLHPALLRYIIELFTDRKINTHGAQLLFTSHDLTTMIPDVFRRDEIWFCALNSENRSCLYPLVTFKKESGNKPRNDEIYGKQYLEGRYGADPYLRRILKWEDIGNE